jgi:GAF domain-containing protein
VPRRIRRALASLGTQVMLLFLVATLVPLGVSLARTAADRRSAEQSAWNQAIAVAGVAAGQVDGTLEAARSTARVVERLPAFWDGADEDRDAILSALFTSQPSLNALAFMTADFQEHGTTTFRPGTPRLDLSGRAYAREAVESGLAAVTDRPLVGLGDGEIILPLAIPVQETGGGPRRGFLIARLKVDRLPSLWDHLPVPPGSVVLLADTREGRILAASGSARGQVGELVEPANLDAMRGGHRAFESLGPDGTKRLVAWTPVGGTPWTVGLTFPLAAVYEPIEAQATQRAAEALVAVGLTYILLLLIWRRLAGRIGLLEAAAARWARGEWAHRVGAAGSDELSRLGSTYDEMAAQLALREAERAQTQARQEILSGAVRGFAAETEPAAVERALVEAAVGLVHGGEAGIARWRPERHELVQVASYPSFGGETPLDLERSAAGQAVLRRESVVVNDYQTVFGATTPAGRLGAPAVVAVPLTHEGQLVGALWVSAFGQGQRFSRLDADALELLAGAAAATLAGLERVRFEGALLAARTAAHEVNNRLALAAGYAELLAVAPDLPERLREMAETASAGVQAAGAVLHRLQHLTHIEETHWGADVGATIDLPRSTGEARAAP